MNTVQNVLLCDYWSMLKKKNCSNFLFSVFYKTFIKKGIKKSLNWMSFVNHYCSRVINPTQNSFVYNNWLIWK